ncbi:putative retrotransposon hot spot (RHS) protein [Trypanosoma rangeli]|uniref:Putative retrotransposon hot spot (RHS) protein n=1 Tax=Trypanosoma rangeli TaxID=5698 RepID=A0A3R7JQ05_TRYRA|nr:putative retrotransposon hot spot (RHS) protein [Trypanosoma rangeli]RNE95000.1 putative retrotransposon hot spot (RHS) protein [Trypanosoma rangeli]|eukprot:RNE95000.1 putative retrotransposon hot spot (RHS) protein [Trypanosoma rangeli]
MNGCAAYEVAEGGSWQTLHDMGNNCGGILKPKQPQTTGEGAGVQVNAMGSIMNCPDSSDVKVLRAWRKRHQPAQEQPKCWEMVEDHMCRVRHVFPLQFQ